MKVMKLSIVLLGAAAMTGCGISLQPFYTAADLYDDPALEGLWSDENSSWLVTHTGFAQYAITSCDDAKEKCTAADADTTATLFRAGGATFLDFQQKSSKQFSDAIRPHGLFQLRRSGSGMEISLLDADELTTAAREKHLPVDHVLLLEERLLLTGRPEQLQQYLTSRLSDPQLFAEWQRLERQ
jgi:hypothetical protein